uniref:Uncharacterized protein n=1 Tax=Brassica oleracea TaxID=3712 RepID=A0A3P6AXT7_BRAOL|nr:unnamed protein product [Brassica oleracea]
MKSPVLLTWVLTWKVVLIRLWKIATEKMQLTLQERLLLLRLSILSSWINLLESKCPLDQIIKP